jgi:hypothetical protein
MKNIQIVDGADNATFSIFQATEEEFAEIFPGDREMELSEDLHARLGEERARAILEPIWKRPVLKRDAMGISGTLFFDWQNKRRHLPGSMREVDWNDSAINEAQRQLFRSARDQT